MLLLLTRICAAQADPVDDLAPGPRELAAAEDELAARLVAAEAIGRAVARLQGAWASLPGKGAPCKDPARGPLSVRFRHFADAWHDAVQRVRVQAERTSRTAQAPTVVPILDPERTRVLDALTARARSQEAAWLELVAWTARAMPRACDLPLVPAEGIPDPIVRTEAEAVGAIAVTATGGGWLCPAAIPAEGQVAVIAGSACWSEQPHCACDPARVHPAAVLGPPPESLDHGVPPELRGEPATPPP